MYLVLLVPLLSWVVISTPRYLLECTYIQPELQCTISDRSLTTSQSDSFTFDVRGFSGYVPLPFESQNPQLVAMFKATGRRLRSFMIASAKLTALVHFHFDLDDPTNTFSQAFDGADETPNDHDYKKLPQGPLHSLRLFSNKLSIVVTNKTPYEFTLASSSSSSMSEWSPPQTLSNTAPTTFNLNFGSEIFSKGSAIAVYALGEIQDALTISAKDLGIQFTYSSKVNDQHIFTFPPPLKNSQAYRIPLIDGATMSLMVVDCSAQGVKQPVEESKAAFLKHWMGSMLDVVGDLSYNNFYIAGTHDSGTWDMKNKLIEFWTQDQTIDIAQQLAEGARVIDVRSGELADKSDPHDKFIFVHGDFYSNSREYDGLMMVRDFVDANPYEIVVVDIHSMVKFGGGDYDYEAQRDMILEIFEPAEASYLIGPEHYGKSLNQMFAVLKPTQRVILAWDSDKSRDAKFWPALDQQWDGNSISSVSLVEDFLQKVYTPPLPTDKLWAGQAEIYTLSGPTYLSPDLENWFYCEGDWASKAYIVNVDFIQQTYIPELTIACTFLRGSRTATTTLE